MSEPTKIDSQCPNCFYNPCPLTNGKYYCEMCGEEWDAPKAETYQIKQMPPTDTIDINGNKQPLVGALLEKAYRDARYGIQTGASKATIDMGFVEIDGKQHLVSIIISSEWE